MHTAATDRLSVSNGRQIGARRDLAFIVTKRMPVDNFLARMPPAEPEPMIAKSTGDR
jgi:hypothetical protein